MINKVKAHVTKSNRALVSYKAGSNIASGWKYPLQVPISTIHVPQLNDAVCRQQNRALTNYLKQTHEVLTELRYYHHRLNGESAKEAMLRECQMSSLSSSSNFSCSRQEPLSLANITLQFWLNVFETFPPCLFPLWCFLHIANGH